MGLERQHEIQKSILARFGSHELASCFLEVTSPQLEIGYLQEACTCVIPQHTTKHGGIQGIMKKWKTLTNGCDLKPCYDIEAEQFDEDRNPCWQDVNNTVKKTHGQQFEEALNLVDEQMKKIAT